MKERKNKKAFTLIELIVILAVIGVLVLLAMPKFLGYTQKATLTKIISNIKVLENASELYYMDNADSEWPISKPLYQSELVPYKNQVINKQGEVIILDPSANYYLIDYSELRKDHVKGLDEPERYIIQNPVGSVYYVAPEGFWIFGKDNSISPPKTENIGSSGNNKGNYNELPEYNSGLTLVQDNIKFVPSDTNIVIDWSDSNGKRFEIIKDGTTIANKNKNDLSYVDNDVVKDTSYNYQVDVKDSSGTVISTVEKEVVASDSPFINTGNTLFDGDKETCEVLTTATRKITWRQDVDLTNVKISIDTNKTGNGLTLTVQDENNVNVPFIDVKTGNIVQSGTLSSAGTYDFIMPAEGKSFVINSSNGICDIYFNSLQLPREPRNVDFEPSYYSMSLNWEEPVEAVQYAVFKDKVFEKYVNPGEFHLSKVLYSNYDYLYEVQSINEYGNRSNLIGVNTTTISDGVEFRSNLGPSFFDDDNLGADVYNKTLIATWNKDITHKSIKIVGSGKISFRDKNNNTLPFVNAATGATVTSLSIGEVTVIVPEGATQLVASGYTVSSIRVLDLSSPDPITNLKTTPSHYTVHLTWSEDTKVAVYRDGTFVSYATGTSFTDKSLYSNQEYTYKVYSINEQGNWSKLFSETKATTISDGVEFRSNLGSSCFDDDNNGVSVYNKTLITTWNKDITHKSIKIVGSGKISFRDKNNNTLPFVNAATGATVTSLSIGEVTVIVPEGATQLVASGYTVSSIRVVE